MTTSVMEKSDELDEVRVAVLKPRRVSSVRRRWECLLAVTPVRTERAWPLTRAN